MKDHHERSPVPDPRAYMEPWSRPSMPAHGGERTGLRVSKRQGGGFPADSPALPVHVLVRGSAYSWLREAQGRAREAMAAVALVASATVVSAIVSPAPAVVSFREFARPVPFAAHPVPPTSPPESPAGTTATPAAPVPPVIERPPDSTQDPASDEKPTERSTEPSPPAAPAPVPPRIVGVPAEVARSTSIAATVFCDPGAVVTASGYGAILATGSCASSGRWDTTLDLRSLPLPTGTRFTVDVAQSNTTGTSPASSIDVVIVD